MRNGRALRRVRPFWHSAVVVEWRLGGRTPPKVRTVAQTDGGRRSGALKPVRYRREKRGFFDARCDRFPDRTAAFLAARDRAAEERRAAASAFFDGRRTTRTWPDRTRPPWIPFIAFS